MAWKRRRRRSRTSGEHADGAPGSQFDGREEVPRDLIPEGELVEEAPETLDGEVVASMARKVDALEAESQRRDARSSVWPVTLVLSLAVILLLVVYSLVA